MCYKLGNLKIMRMPWSNFRLNCLKSRRIIHLKVLRGMFSMALLGAMALAQSSASDMPAIPGDPLSSVPSGPEKIVNSDRQNTPESREAQANSARTAEPGRGRAGAPLAEEVPNEFQNFILLTTGQLLPVFGNELFRNVPATFAPLDRVPVPSDYVIGPGDELQLRGWGQVEIDYRAVVDRTGNIFVPKVGAINVSGIKYGELQPFLKGQISRVFHTFELAVTMGQLRSIQVFVVGQARRPGSYTVSALSTLVNSVFSTGGASTKGSLRRIQLKRGDRVVTEFDLYDLLLHGDKSKDVPMLPGDVIYFPPVGPLVGVMGSVNVPAIYEVKDGENLDQLIRMAGGLTPTAAGQVATVERTENRTVRAVEETALDEKGRAFPLKDGDLVSIRSIPVAFDNAVTLRGNVSNSGRYAWKQGMRVSDLIPDRKALVTREYWLRKGQIVQRPDLAEARSLDRLKQILKPPQPVTPATTPVPNAAATGPGQEAARNSQDTTKPSADEVELQKKNEAAKLGGGVDLQAAADAEKQRIENERARAGRYGEDSPLASSIRRITPEINWDYAAIQRLDPQSLSTRLLTFNLGRALEAPDSSDNIALEPGDILTIFSQADIQIPIAKQTKFVRLEGEFKVAGVYEVLPGETLRQLVERAGGFTPAAYLFGAEFLRESARESQQHRFDEFVSRLELEVERNASTKAQNVVSAEEATSLAAKVESQRRLVEKLRTIRPQGRVVLGIRPGTTSLEQVPDITLEDGDRFVVPYQPATVNVTGSVYNENSYVHQPSHTVGFYLRQAGGGTPTADLNHLLVVRADGSVVGKHRSAGWFSSGFNSLRLMPGDTIVVPERLDRVSVLKGLRDWTQVFAQLALGAAVLKSLNQ